MEEKLLTDRLRSWIESVWRHGNQVLSQNRARVLWFKVIFLTMTAWPGLCLSSESMTISEYSLSSGPQPTNISLISVNPWQLNISVRFSNECLASTGLKAFHLDLRYLSGTARLIRLAQNKTPYGCPEIWQPVIRHYLIRVADRNAIDKVMMMDWSGKGEGSDKLLQLLTLTREDVARDIKKDISRVSIGTFPMFPGRVLPVIENLNITPGPRSGYLRDYKVDFTVQLPLRFTELNKITSHVVETRTGVSDLLGQPIIDWLFVTIPVDNKHRDAEGATRNIRYEIKLQLLQTYEHRLVVANPGYSSSTLAEQFFRIYNIH
jgi:hypothetical protein